MNNCTYTLNGEIYKGESNLNEVILNNYEELIKIIPEDSLFSYDKTTKDLLDIEQKQASQRLKVTKSEALAKYLNTDDDTKYDDGYLSVSDWIIKNKLAKGVDRKAYKLFKSSQLQIDNPTLTLEQAENLINKDFTSWTYTQYLGRGLHYVMQTIFNSKNPKITPSSIRESLNNSWTKGYSKNATLNGVTDEALESFIKEVMKLKRKIVTSDTEKVYTEYLVDTEVDEENKIRGKIDILVLDKSGNLSIYDLKVSTKKEENWDTDKKDFVDYQLATYKKLLEYKGINPNKITTYTISVDIDLNTDNIAEENNTLKTNGDVVTIINVDEPKPKALDAEKAIKFKELFPTPSTVTLNRSHLVETVSDNLVKYFPVECLNNNKFENITKQTLLEKVKQNNEGKFIFRDPIKNSFEIFNTREEAEEYIEKFLENSSESLAERVVSITQAFSKALKIVNSKKHYVPINFDFPNIKGSEQQAYVNILFSKYTYEKGWSVVENDDLINMGTIMLINDTDKKVDFITLTDMDLSMKVKLNKGENLLGSFYTDLDIETDDNKMIATKGNIELIKLLEIANNILVDDIKDYTIDELVVSNLVNGDSLKPITLDKLIYNYNILRNKNNLSNSNIKTLDPLVKFYSAFLQIQSGISNVKSEYRLNRLLKENIKIPKVSITELTPEEKNQQINQLYNLLEELKNKFFYKSGYVPEESLASYLYVEIAKAIVNLTGIEVDPYNSPKLATWFGDVLKDGKLNRQFLNSTKLNSADTIKIIQPIKRELDRTRYNIRSKFFTYKMNTRNKYSEFKKNSSIASNRFINMSELDYKNLFDNSENGKKYFLLKDPKSDKTLTPKQKEFLEFYLKDINGLRFPGQTEEELRASGQWLMAGIMKASTASRIANAKGVKNIITALNSDVTDEIINRKHIVEESNIKSFSELNDKDMMEMYNIFSTNTSLEAREKYIDRARKDKGGFDDPMNIFETNLEIVADSMHLAYIREYEYNKILPTIQSNLTLLRLASFISNDKDITKMADFISDHIKTTVFDESLIGDENKQLYEIMSHVKRTASGFILGFNWKSGIKESAVSFLTLYNRAVANTLADKDQIGVKDMTKAYTTVWKDALTQVATVTKLEALNMVYGISNMSEDELVQRMNYYQGDLMRFNANLFWCNRAPDYLNRMTLLVGYMMKYGCWEAYTFKDNELVYDWKKDKRFDLYAKYKDKEDSLSEDLLEKYNYQKSLYNTMLNRFVEQRYEITDKNGNKRLITTKDELPHAFVDLEVASIKQEADMLFGYMDNDNKSDVFKTGIFTIIGHFKTYLTAKKNQWFLSRDTYAGGHFVQAKNLDGQLLYMHYDENNKLISINTEKSDIPYIKWEGKITEGIFWSLVDLLYTPSRALFTGDWESVKKAWSDPIKRRNFIIAMQDWLMYALLYWLLSLAYDGVKTGELSPSQRTFLGLTRDVRNELNVAKVLIGGTEFNAPSLNFAQNVYDDMSDVFDGKLNLGRAFINNFGALRPLRYSLYEYFPNPEYEHTAVTDLF